MADFKKIYFGDYSKEGYDDGFKEGQHSRSKNKFRFFKAIHPINYIWNFNNAYNSYMKNYDKGYLDSQRVEHNVYYQNKTKGVDMTSYEAQLQMLENFDDNLKALREKITELRDKYKHQIDVMESAGFFSNYIDPLRAKYADFSQKIDDIDNLIQHHKQKIGLQKETLIDLINSAGE